MTLPFCATPLLSLASDPVWLTRFSDAVAATEEADADSDAAADVAPGSCCKPPSEAVAPAPGSSCSDPEDPAVPPATPLATDPAPAATLLLLLKKKEVVAVAVAKVVGSATSEPEAAAVPGSDCRSAVLLLLEKKAVEDARGASSSEVAGAETEAPAPIVWNPAAAVSVAASEDAASEAMAVSSVASAEVDAVSAPAPTPVPMVKKPARDPVAVGATVSSPAALLGSAMVLSAGRGVSSASEVGSALAEGLSSWRPVLEASSAVDCFCFS